GGAEGQIAVDDRRLWTWWGRTATGEELQLDQLPLPQLDVINAATALQVVALQPLAVGPDVVRQALSGLGLAGRFQRLEDPRHGIEVRTDVGHNPHAAVMLAQKLKARRERLERAGDKTSRGLVRVVLAMMSDKDHRGYHAALE